MLDFLKRFIKQPQPKIDMNSLSPVVRNLKEKHEWQLISTTYAEPIRDFSGIDLSKLEISVVQKMSLGLTTYIFECALTGDIRTYEVLGSENDTLQDILDRVNKYGKRVVKDRFDNAYLVDRYFSPKDLKSLPVRK